MSRQPASLSPRAVDMTGATYGSLTAIKPVGRMRNGNKIWQFQCTCGMLCEIDGYAVRRGKAISCQSCGAARTQAASVTHGMSSTREFSTWTDIQTRCGNPNRKDYPDYGGRGIKVCERWLSSFEAFYEDMGPRPSSGHSIERDDVNGDYEPSNCRWATAAEQAMNRRNNRRIEINGVTKTLGEWASESGLTSSAIHFRIKAGVSGAALLAPSKRNGCLTFLGHTDTYAGWSRRTGIKTSTIAMRISRLGWSAEKTLTVGATL